jgi:hypothetical protein
MLKRLAARLQSEAGDVALALLVATFIGVVLLLFGVSFGKSPPTNARGALPTPSKAKPPVIDRGLLLSLLSARSRGTTRRRASSRAT